MLLIRIKIEIFLGFWYQIMNEIGGERGGRMRGVGYGESKIGIPIRGYQVFVWRGDIQLLTYLMTVAAHNFS